jgi:hypothetical protein
MLQVSPEASDRRLSPTPSRKSATHGCLKVLVVTACRQELLSGYVASGCCRERQHKPPRRGVTVNIASELNWRSTRINIGR